MASPCTNNPNEVISAVVGIQTAEENFERELDDAVDTATENADKFNAFVNGSDTQTVQLGEGAATPTIRNAVRQMMSAAATLDSADVSGKSTTTNNGGAILRTLAARFGDWINVKDFGAKGDGTTDDTTALQSVFTYANTLSKSVVYFPQGTYRVSSEIKIGGNLTVYAYGAIIQCIGDAEFFGVIQNTLGYDENGPGGYSGNSNIFWFGGTIDANAQDIAATKGRQQMTFIHGENIHIADVIFKNARRVHSAEFAGVRNGSYKNCSFLGQYPPVIENYYPEMLQLNPVSAGGTPGQYTDNTECEDIVIENCLFTNIENSNILTDSSPYAGCGSHGNEDDDTTKNVIIKNCVFKGVRYYPITCYTTNFENWTIENCFVDGGYIGINCQPKQNATVTSKGFTIKNCLIKNVTQVLSVYGYTGLKTCDINIEDNIGIASSIFGGLSYLNRVYFHNNTFILSKDQTSQETTSIYCVYDSNVIVDGYYHICGSFTSSYTDAIRVSSGNENFKSYNVYSDKCATPVGIGFGINGEGIKSKTYNSATAFFATTGSGDNSAASPSIALITSDAYTGPHIGFDASKGFRMAAYADDSNGISRISKHAFYIRVKDDTATSLAVCPGTDNKQPSGTASNRWSQVYAGTGTINTSDERQKENIAIPDESVLRAWGKVRVKVFQFKDAVAKKGVEARMHVGIVAQDVQKAFAEEGLDAARYSLFCFDKWQAEYAENVVVDVDAKFDADGKEVSPAQTHTEKVEISPAGESYGIRYEEALALECAYQRWLGEKRDARIAELEARLNEISGNGTASFGA